MRLAAFLVSILLCAQSQGNRTSKVREFIDEWHALEVDLTEDGAESAAIDRLQQLANNTERLLQLGTPVGVLVATGADLNFEPTSDEGRARAELHALSVYVEQNEKKEIPYKYRRPSFNVFGIDKEYPMTPYDIHQHLKSWSLEFHFITHPRGASSGGKDDFIKECGKMSETSPSPSRMLEDLEETYVKACSIPTEDGVTTLVRVQRAFRHLENRIPVTGKDIFGLYNALSYRYADEKSRVLSLITILRTEYVNDLIRLLEKSTLSSEKDVVYIVAKLSELRIFLYKKCALRMIYNEYDQRRGPLLLEVNHLTNEILRLELMSVACAKLKYDLEIVSRIKNVANHIKEWMETLQRVSWPRVGIEAAKKAIGIQDRSKPSFITDRYDRSPIPGDNSTISVTAFNKTAETIHGVFEERGKLDESYQVLVSRTSAVDEWWSVWTETDGVYANFTNHRGVDVHIFRFPNGDSERAENAKKWVEDNREDVIDELRNGVTGTAAEMMKALIANPTTKAGLHLHKASIIFRGKSLLKKDAEIPVQFHPPRSDIIHSVEYTENGFFAHHWKLVLLV